MTLEHVAIWTNQIEQLRNYYQTYFGGVSNEKYTNEAKGFCSYFLSFEGGARLELMSMRDVPNNLNDTVNAQHLGIIHLAFGVNSIDEVDRKARELASAGYSILSGPRYTGDGYYEFETLDPDDNRIEVTFQVPDEIKVRAVR